MNEQKNTIDFVNLNTLLLYTPKYFKVGISVVHICIHMHVGICDQLNFC